MIWCYLVHLGYNMWEDREAPPIPPGLTPRLRRVLKTRRATDDLRFDTPLWDELIDRMADAGVNMCLLDLGDGVRYASHPEIAVKHAWTPRRLRRELGRLRERGIEPIPKLNFSATHDAWLGAYERCVSTDTYYAVCRDLIAEVCDLFDRPRLFHLGMDEETCWHQRYSSYVVVRQGDLWWEDLRRLVHCAEAGGARAWVWSDYLWNHPGAFWRNMPRRVVQSNWYYGSVFHARRAHVRAYVDLEKHGYEQIPTGSNFSVPENFPQTVRYCAARVAPERLLGFCQTSWLPTQQAYRRHHRRALRLVAEARRRLEQP